MNHKNTKKSPNHEHAYANIPCNFGDRNISCLGVAYLTHVIHRCIHRYIATWIIVRFGDPSVNSKLEIKAQKYRAMSYLCVFLNQHIRQLCDISTVFMMFH